jgi:aryl-alcohol dehydrogenase-like predicted oxidoreductase
VEEVAKKKGITMAQVNIAWLLSKEGMRQKIIPVMPLNELSRRRVCAYHWYHQLGQS